MSHYSTVLHEYTYEVRSNSCPAAFRRAKGRKPPWFNFTGFPCDPRGQGHKRGYWNSPVTPGQFPEGFAEWTDKHALLNFHAVPYDVEWYLQALSRSALLFRFELSEYSIVYFRCASSLTSIIAQFLYRNFVRIMSFSRRLVSMRDNLYKRYLYLMFHQLNIFKII